MSPFNLHCAGCGAITAVPPLCGPCFADRADLRRQLARVEAVLRAGRGPQLYASRRKAEIERHLAELGEPC